jgi:protein-tyrosine phosphatase
MAFLQKELRHHALLVLLFSLLSVAHSSLAFDTAEESSLRAPRRSNMMPMATGGGDKDKLRGPDVQPPRPNDNTYWVKDQLIAGEYPADNRGEEESRAKIREYLDLGITYFVDLTHIGEKHPYEAMLKEEAVLKNVMVSYRRIPLQDFGIPTEEEMKSILDTIDNAIANGRKVYVHCRAGIGRTGTTVGCFLVRNGNSGSEALDEVNRLFQFSDRSFESSCSPETKAQMQFVRDWKG